MYVFFSMSATQRGESTTTTNRLCMETLPGNHDAVGRLQAFKLDDAHCWSQTDETMLRNIISEDASGFEANIRATAKCLLGEMNEIVIE